MGIKVILTSPEAEDFRLTGERYTFGNLNTPYRPEEYVQVIAPARHGSCHVGWVLVEDLAAAMAERAHD